MKLGYTLPTLQTDPDLPLAVARRAEATGGIDAVFAFDHLFRVARDGTHRPALDGFAILSAAAAQTTRIGLGTLVARATLRPPAVLANMFASLQRVSGGRVIAGIGAGDSESKPEMDAFGIPFGDEASRVADLAAALDATRAVDLPVWIGGRSAPVRTLAATRADGWNRWGGDREAFRAQTAQVRAEAGDRPFAVSWGGLVCLGETDRDARAKAERLGAGPDVIVGGPAGVAAALAAWADAGADWIVVGAIDASNPDNVELLGTDVAAQLA